MSCGVHASLRWSREEGGSSDLIFRFSSGHLMNRDARGTADTFHAIA